MMTLVTLTTVTREIAQGDYSCISALTTKEIEYCPWNFILFTTIFQDKAFQVWLPFLRPKLHTPKAYYEKIKIKKVSQALLVFVKRK